MDAILLNHGSLALVPQPFFDVYQAWQRESECQPVVFLSRITSPTALVFPAEEICRWAREAEIFCIVDGAHIPSQIPLDLSELGADIYAGAATNSNAWNRKQGLALSSQLGVFQML